MLSAMSIRAAGARPEAIDETRKLGRRRRGLGGVRRYPRSAGLDDDARGGPMSLESAGDARRSRKGNGAAPAMYCVLTRFLKRGDSW
jgi:hypothetical protein